jgi:hypothetical protein
MAPIGPTPPVLAQLQHLAGWAAYGLGRFNEKQITNNEPPIFTKP